jgi:hypothetical protein
VEVNVTRLAREWNDDIPGIADKIANLPPP